MTEKEEQKQELPDAAAAAQTSAPVTHVKKQISKGEKIYDSAVYTGLNYWVNLALSLVIADYFIHDGGKKWITGGAQWIGKTFAREGGVAQQNMIRNASNSLKTFSLLSGGWALLYPMKKLEDNKRNIVHWTNEMLGVDQHAPDGHKETPDEIYIECEQPKQSWGNVITRRLMATAAVIISGQALNWAARDRKKTAEWHASGPHEAHEDPHGGKAVTERFIIDTVNKGLKSGYVPNGEKIANNDTFRRYLGMAALDSIFTKVTAVVMKTTNGAKKAQMPKEIGDDDAPNAVRETPDHIYTVPDAPHPLAESKSFKDSVRSSRSATEASEDMAPERYKRQTVLQRSIHPSKVNEPGESTLALSS